MVQGACHKHLVSVSPMNALACLLKPAKDFGLGRRIASRDIETAVGCSRSPILRRAILFDEVLVSRQLGKIVIYKGTQLFELSP